MAKRDTEGKKKAGRPRKEIDFDNLENLCKIQCTLAEVAGFFGLSEDTVKRRVREHYNLTFEEAFRIYSAPGRISLRRWQFRMAENNPTMAIWLGKNYLGQSDKVEQTIREDEQAVDRDEKAREMRSKLISEYGASLSVVKVNSKSS